MRDGNKKKQRQAAVQMYVRRESGEEDAAAAGGSAAFLLGETWSANRGCWEDVTDHAQRPTHYPRASTSLKPNRWECWVATRASTCHSDNLYTAAVTWTYVRRERKGAQLKRACYRQA